MPLDDARTYQMLARGDSVGVFQFESSGMREAMRDVAPTVFEDLIALVALYRPGPMEYIPLYARNKRNPEGISYVDPRLEPILRGTNGVAIYQEQLMEIAKRVGGFTPSEADDLRKAIGKKIRAILDRLEPKFREGAGLNGTAPQVIDHLWSLMEKAGDYSFNKSHAACYALIAYQTAYLKATYPVQYMAALISSVMNTKDKVPFYVSLANDMGIEVLPPDVNESSLDFRAVETRIRFGLNAVKNVGESAIRSILSARDSGGAFLSLFDFCERVDLGAVNRRALESLIKAGALDSTGASRKGHAAGDRPGHGPRTEGPGRCGAGPGLHLRPHARLGRRPGVDVERRERIPRNPPSRYPPRTSARKSCSASRRRSWACTSRRIPCATCAARCAKKRNISSPSSPTLPDGATTTIVGMVANVKKVPTKSGGTMAFVTVEGLEGSVEMICFNKTYLENIGILQEDRLIKVRGRLERKDEAEQKFVPFTIEAFVPRTGFEPVCILLDGERVARRHPRRAQDHHVAFPRGMPGRAARGHRSRASSPGVRRWVPGGAGHQSVRGDPCAAGRGRHRAPRAGGAGRVAPSRPARTGAAPLVRTARFALP